MANVGPSQEKKKKIDYYKVLGVPRGAGNDQIKSAYRRLALQCHPDKTKGDPELEQQFQDISQAYTVLSDPAKRRQYDTMGEAAVELEALDMERMGLGTTLVAALFSKLGAPIPTAIPQRTLDVATDAGARDNAVQIVWGQPMEGCVAKSGAQFYRAEVDEAVAERGLRVYVHSAAGSKFKVLWFDQGGSLLTTDESVACTYGRPGTEACTYLCSFKAMHLDTQPKSFRLVDEEECPPVFRKLETLAPSRHSPLRTGRLHIAIQGDNFFRDVKYTLTVSLLDPSFKDQVLEAEESLASKRDEICKLEREYWDARNKYEKMCEKVALETERVEDSLMERDNLYAQMTKDEVMLSGVRDVKARVQLQRQKAKEKAEKAKERRS